MKWWTILWGGLLALPVMAADWWEPAFWATWQEPESESWTVTGSFWDSDEDAVYALQRGWRRGLPESAWELAWEVGLGVADSGKTGKTGALGTLDLVARRPLWRGGRFEVGINGVAGLQLQSIRFPGGSHHNGRIGGFFDFTWGGAEARALEWRLGYLHISNANLGSGNEGHDAIWAGAGWRW
jgi:hypothetical protein